MTQNYWICHTCGALKDCPPVEAVLAACPPQLLKETAPNFNEQDSIKEIHEEDLPRMVKPGNPETPLTATALSDPTRSVEIEAFLTTIIAFQGANNHAWLVSEATRLQAALVAACPPTQEEKCPVCGGDMDGAYGACDECRIQAHGWTTSPPPAEARRRL